MRPLKLTISAFGPYPAAETIDFNNLKDKNIFLITGPTGAGKTTIFDAISYALFGEASGSSRDNDSLRSHFAQIESLTFVELEFELRGEKFRVKRNPKQEAKKLKGEGTRIKESDAELEMPDGKLITQIKSVDEKISNLLGINKNQFRQIVMLPQGEFRKLLEAESKEREVIFRKIFGTEAFQIIQQKLDNMQKLYYRKVEEGKTKREAHVKHIQTVGDEDLTRLVNAKDLNIIEIVDKTEEMISRDEQYNNSLSEEIKAVKESQEKLQKDIIEGNEINKRLREKEEQCKLYNIQILREEEYKEKKLRLEKGRKAVQVKLVEDNLLDRKANLQSKEKQYRAAEENIVKALKNIAIWEDKLKEEESKEEHRKKTAQVINSLKDKEQKVKLYEQKILSIEDLRKALSNKKVYLEQFKVDLNRDKDNHSKAVEKLNNLINCETELLKVSKIVDENNLLMENLKELRNKARQYKNNLKGHQEKAQEYADFERKYLACKSEFEALENRFLKEQAGILAQALVEGTECPVCGSKHHPKPAEIFQDAPTEEKVKEAKAAFNLETEEKNRILQVLFELKGKIEASRTELQESKLRLKAALGDNIISMSEDEILSYINGKGPKLKEKVDELMPVIEKLQKAISQRQETEEYVKKLQKDIETKEALLPKLEEEYTELFGKSAGEEEQLKITEREIPEDIRSASKLQAKIHVLESELTLLEEAYKKAVESYNTSKTMYASVNADKTAKYDIFIEAQKEVEQWEVNLQSKVAASGFTTYEEYSIFRMTEREIDALDKDIAEYYKKLQSLKDGLEKLEKETKDLEIINVAEILKSKAELKLHEDKLTEMKENIISRIKNNKSVVNEINKINSEISEDEAKHSVIYDIHKAANGFNEERITFERYVLAAYFDEIINAANLRLNKMAGGRFVLKRKEEKGKGLRQEGLELEVFDNYTGRARHVKTLSGGESFKASLALALGLADVVQSYAGGISLDTMFVDEGFGTLDPESLEHAIQCLIDLQKSGRLVGIISHVPELKERIDARLEITPAKEGSKARFIV
jgi:DNA repair protein SbcC/Rad50